jgi:hypothetical protein
MQVFRGDPGNSWLPGVRKFGRTFCLFWELKRSFWEKLLEFGLSENQHGIAKNMQNGSAPQEKKLGQRGPIAARNTWVQTERKAHEAWADMIAKRPRAAQLMHRLVACMGQQNAVVISQKLLAQMMGVTDRTVRNAIADLVADRWISVVKLNGPGTVAAYVINDQVAWGEARQNLHTSVFSATVIADKSDQDSTLIGANLRRIPTLFHGDRQLPTGDGEDPPSQPSIPGLEPDLPSIKTDFESRAQMPLNIDPETGEIK